MSDDGTSEDRLKFLEAYRLQALALIQKVAVCRPCPSFMTCVRKGSVSCRVEADKWITEKVKEVQG